jgi:hypothetical protein
MASLVLIVQQPLRIIYLNDCPGFPAHIDGFFYQVEEIDEDVVFYDWLADSEDRIHGLEIHIPSSALQSKSKLPLTEVLALDLNIYPRFWLSQQRDGSPLGLEAFGDIAFGRSTDGRLAIIVGLDNWLTPAQSGQLQSLYGQQAGGDQSPIPEN